jgi:hypothetical protein
MSGSDDFSTSLEAATLCKRLDFVRLSGYRPWLTSSHRRLQGLSEVVHLFLPVDSSIDIFLLE